MYERIDLFQFPQMVLLPLKLKFKRTDFINKNEL